MKVYLLAGVCGFALSTSICVTAQAKQPRKPTSRPNQRKRVPPKRRQPKVAKPQPQRRKPASRPTSRKAAVGGYSRVPSKPGVGRLRVKVFQRPHASRIVLRRGKVVIHPYTTSSLRAVLKKNPKALINKKILVQGTVRRASGKKLSCTLMLCPKGMPCCNRCSQPLMLHYKNNTFGLELSGKYGGKYVGCFGTECFRRCAPLQHGKRYRMRVIVRRRKIVTARPIPIQELYTLELSSFQSL